MTLAYIHLENLGISPVNMRAKHKDRDIAALIPSVEARGVLVPLLVRLNGEPDRYEVIAGRRRYFAAKSVVATRGEAMALPCVIVEAGDDVAALEASLIENVERLDADEVTQWETFSRLIRLGRCVEQIAATFGLADSVVRRVLALGNLQSRIRTLYRNEKIDAATVRYLTMATTAQQREWLTLYDSADNHAPTGRVLKEWLFGGAAIPVSSARFDLAGYTAPIVADLFGDHSYFSDSALFWELQGKALEEIRQGYLAGGWSEVVILDRGRWFERWAYEKRSRGNGGRVYLTVSEQGEVEVNEGYVPHKEARGRGNDAPARARPEMSAPMRRYVDLHRHAVVRAALLHQPWTALRLMLAHVIAGSPLWSVRCERQQDDKPETERSIAESPPQQRFAGQSAEAIAQLGFAPDSTTVIGGGRNLTLELVFGALLRLTDDELLALAPVIMGETLEAGGDAIDLVGTLLEIEMSAQWQPDEAFYTLVRDRKLLSAMVEEVAGAEVAKANIAAPAKVLLTILRDCLTGANGRARVESWTPRWLRFPPSNYFGANTHEADMVEMADDGVSVIFNAAPSPDDEVPE